MKISRIVDRSFSCTTNYAGYDQLSSVEKDKRHRSFIKESIRRKYPFKFFGDNIHEYKNYRVDSLYSSEMKGLFSYNKSFEALSLPNDSNKNQNIQTDLKESFKQWNDEVELHKLRKNERQRTRRGVTRAQPEDNSELAKYNTLESRIYAAMPKAWPYKAGRDTNYGLPVDVSVRGARDALGIDFSDNNLELIKECLKREANSRSIFYEKTKSEKTKSEKAKQESNRAEKKQEKEVKKTEKNQRIFTQSISHLETLISNDSIGPEMLISDHSIGTDHFEELETAQLERARYDRLYKEAKFKYELRNFSYKLRKNNDIPFIETTVVHLDQLLAHAKDFLGSSESNEEIEELEQEINNHPTQNVASKHQTQAMRLPPTDNNSMITDGKLSSYETPTDQTNQQFGSGGDKHEWDKARQMYYRVDSNNIMDYVDSKGNPESSQQTYDQMYGVAAAPTLQAGYEPSQTGGSNTSSGWGEVQYSSGNITYSRTPVMYNTKNTQSNYGSQPDPPANEEEDIYDA